MNDIITLLLNLQLGTILKIPLLVLFFLYAIFAAIVFNQVRSLSKLVLIPAPSLSTVLLTLSLLHLLLAIALFIAAVVIL